MLFLCSSEVLAVFDILSVHANVNLPNGSFSHEQLLISKYFSIFYALLHSQSCVLEFHKQSFLQELQSSNSLQSHRY